MKTITGSKFIFDYPAEFTSLEDYNIHRGQVVLVLRPLSPGIEYDDQGERMFRIRADDGWEGDAFRSELREIAS